MRLPLGAARRPGDSGRAGAGRTASRRRRRCATRSPSHGIDARTAARPRRL